MTLSTAPLVYGAKQRCPICHDRLRKKEVLCVCLGCAAIQHALCRDELGGCSTLGCERVTASDDGEPEEPTDDEPEAAVEELETSATVEWTRTRHGDRVRMLWAGALVTLAGLGMGRWVMSRPLSQTRAPVTAGTSGGVRSEWFVCVEHDDVLSLEGLVTCSEGQAKELGPIVLFIDGREYARNATPRQTHAWPVHFRVPISEQTAFVEVRLGEWVIWSRWWRR